MECRRMGCIYARKLTDRGRKEREGEVIAMMDCAVSEADIDVCSKKF